jgi:predicted negative regulator of RcsB-dependent stress response
LNDSFPQQFAAEVADRKGDVLVAQNKLIEARQAYVAALAAMPKEHPGRQLVTVKLEAIGGTAPAEAKDAKAAA